ncbi:hypothetical protein, partial [Mesotoga sp.]|uniref:hypothetical protein n=1 Tax=Mesotoga sp. TaxID=2053577 RepID=UPI00345EB3E7
MAVTFNIDSTDRTTWLHIKTVRITLNLGARGVMSCHLRSTTNFFSDIDVGKEVELYKDSTLVFAGTIDSIDKWKQADVYYADLQCVDFNQLADRFVVKKTYEQFSPGDIIRDLINTYLSADGVSAGTIFEHTTTSTTPSPVDKAIYTFAPVYEVLDEIATIAGVTWWIDYDKKLHFTTNVTSGTAYITTGSAIREVVVSKDRETLANKIYIRGGRIETDELEEEFTSDGATRTFLLEYPISRVMTVEVDRGSGYVEEVHGSATVQKNTIQTDLGWYTQETTWAAPGSDYSDQKFIFEDLAGRADVVVTGIKDVVFTWNSGAGFIDWEESGNPYLTDLSTLTPVPTTENKVYWEYGENYAYIGRVIDTAPGYVEARFGVRLGVMTPTSVGWLWQEDSNTIVDGNTTPTAATDKIKVTYHGYTDAVFSFEDATAVAARASAEGGSGYYEMSLIDKSIDTKEMAEERG